MKKHLFIIEAPGKVKKIKSILGSNYTVLATKGHIADLPAKGLNVDIRKDFEPTFAVNSDKKDIVKKIKSELKNVDNVYIATDMDREGEGVAWLVSEQIKGNNYKRVKYNAITKADILKGIENASDINQDLVDAFISRRILDRIAGYKTSYNVKIATGGKSAGRVQSAALRILAEREKEIQEFVPIVYYPVTAKLETKSKDIVVAGIKKPKSLDISTQEQADSICESIENNKITVSKFEEKEQNTKAQAPFTADSMYRAASSIFGWKTKKTASVAQGLYSSGAITYHRTDSTFLSADAIKDIRSVIKDIGANYLPSKQNVYASAKNSQEAHEACRVTDLSVREYTSGSLEEAKLYKMIWKRTVSCQMTPMVKKSIQAEFSVDEYILSASGSKLIFDGWRNVWDYGSIIDVELPEMTVGDEAKCLEVKNERKETQPPPRYSEGSFIKKLKDVGIGRPSTYPSIASTLENRHYIVSDKSLSVTELGMKVNDFLVGNKFCFAETDFTANMEQKLDDIAQGKTTKLEVLTEFWHRLRDDIKNAKSEKKEVVKTEHVCKDCKKEGKKAFLCERDSRFGKFLSCENYPKCKFKAEYDEEGKVVYKEPKKLVYSKDYTCPVCESKMVHRKSQYGEFFGCEKYPKCRGVRDMDGENKTKTKKKSKWKKR